MLDERMFLKDVYARPLGNQIMYWRIDNGLAEKAVLEWAIVDVGRNLGADLFREYQPAAISAMKVLQKPQRTVALDDVDGHLREHFLEWGWINPVEPN